MKREIRDKRNELREESLVLRELATDDLPYELGMEIREMQDDTYNRWRFYDNLIKVMEEV